MHTSPVGDPSQPNPNWVPGRITPTCPPPTDRFKVELEGRDGISIYDTSTGIVNILRVEDGIALANQLTSALDTLHTAGVGEDHHPDQVLDQPNPDPMIPDDELQCPDCGQRLNTCTCTP